MRVFNFPVIPVDVSIFDYIDFLLESLEALIYSKS